MTLVLNAISLWQPWASLLFVSDPELRKVHETRSFPLRRHLFGQPIAIHAAKRVVPKRLLTPELVKLCDRAFDGMPTELPRGAVIGTVIINGWVATEFATPASEADRIAGDWSGGRYAWLVDSAKPIDPIPAIGSQGWFSVEIPEETADAG